MGRDTPGRNDIVGLLGFYPRARMGRDNTLAARQLAPEVSIRAPAWDATFMSGWEEANHMFLSARPHGTRPRPSHSV